MTQSILITSTGEGTGKTAIAIGLGLLAQEAGIEVGYMKPKGTRLRSSVGKVLDADPVLAQEALGIDDPIEEMEPVVYSSTYMQQVIRGRQPSQSIRDGVIAARQRLEEGRDLLIVEGGSESATGSIIDLTDVDIADCFDANVLLIAPYTEISDVDEILHTATTFGSRLMGIVFNNITPEAHDEVEADITPFLERHEIPVLGIIPRKRRLASITIEDLAAEIGASILTECPTDQYVERYTVGAMSGDVALRHFRRARDAVVITGGDRPNVQAAAFEAPGVHGLILTGGYRPTNQIIGAAEERGMPILLVDTDTMTAIDRVESVLGVGRMRNIDGVKTMQELLNGHVDTDQILGRAKSPDRS